jgi:hypothetical protein
LICIDRMSDFMGPGKLSSLVTTLSNRTSLLQGGLWRENEIAQDDDQAERSLGTKILSRKQGPDFDPVRTSRKVVVRETQAATRMMCYQVLPLQGVYRFKSMWHSRI